MRRKAQNNRQGGDVEGGRDEGLKHLKKFTFAMKRGISFSA